jgi:hypothetical protein
MLVRFHIRQDFKVEHDVNVSRSNVRRASCRDRLLDQIPRDEPADQVNARLPRSQSVEQRDQSSFTKVCMGGTIAALMPWLHGLIVYAFFTQMLGLLLAACRPVPKIQVQLDITRNPDTFDAPAEKERRVLTRDQEGYISAIVRRFLVPRSLRRYRSLLWRERSSGADPR